MSYDEPSLLERAAACTHGLAGTTRYTQVQRATNAREHRWCIPVQSTRFVMLCSTVDTQAASAGAAGLAAPTQDNTCGTAHRWMLGMWPVLAHNTYHWHRPRRNQRTIEMAHSIQQKKKQRHSPRAQHAGERRGILITLSSPQAVEPRGVVILTPCTCTITSIQTDRTPHTSNEEVR